LLTVVKPELGTKRSCPSCQTRFYDLSKDPIVCPKCGVAFVAEALLPSKAEQTAAVAKPRPVAEPVAEATEDVELVSLDEVEAAEGEDEGAGIEDVDLGEDAAIAGEDDTFLEAEEEDEANMPDLIVGGKPEDEES
jgi:uncharacterized protein (TIGR02300 family)